MADREARERAIKKASEQVRSGASPFVRRAPDPVPEAAVEAPMIGVCRNPDHAWWFPVDAPTERCPEMGCEAPVALYRLVPQDEQGRREQLKRAMKAGVPFRDTESVLQALDLLPEQEQ